MASRNATVAEAVKTALNLAAVSSATFGASFVAKRVYVPLSDLDSLKGLTVQIFAAGDEREQESRGPRMHNLTVQVGIQKRLTQSANVAAGADNVEVDAMMELVERVEGFFVPPFAAGDAKLVAAQITGPMPDHLLEHRVFTAVVSLTFKYRAA